MFLKAELKILIHIIAISRNDCVFYLLIKITLNQVVLILRGIKKKFSKH